MVQLQIINNKMKAEVAFFIVVLLSINIINAQQNPTPPPMPPTPQPSGFNTFFRGVIKGLQASSQIDGLCFSNVPVFSLAFNEIMRTVSQASNIGFPIGYLEVPAAFNTFLIALDTQLETCNYKEFLNSIRNLFNAGYIATIAAIGSRIAVTNAVFIGKMTDIAEGIFDGQLEKAGKGIGFVLRTIINFTLP